MTTVSIKRHLRELQWRLMLVAAFFIAGACLAYSFQAQLIPLLLNPLGGEKLVYLNPAGGFNFIFLVSIYAGMALSFPVLIQQIYAFLKPALPSAAHKKSPVIIISSFLLLIAGIVFGYMIAVPNALTFLYGFADQYVEASLTAESYLNFIIAYTIGIGIVFQVPLLLLLINSIKPLTPGGLWRSERWVILLSFIVAAIITPTPDPVNQAIIAVPVIAVYQIGVVAVLISIARRKRTTKRTVRKEVRTRALQPFDTTAMVASDLPLETPFASVLATHAELHPDFERDLDVEIEAAIAAKAAQSETHLQKVELDFEEELDAHLKPSLELSEAQQTEIEQALIAAKEADTVEPATDLEEVLQNQIDEQEIVTEEVAQDLTPVLEAELQAELDSTLEPATSLEQELAEEAAIQAMAPPALKPVEQPAQHQPKVRPVDGFGARNPAMRRHAPVRAIETPKPAVVDTRVKNTVPPRGLYIDGFVSTRNAAA